SGGGWGAVREGGGGGAPPGRAQRARRSWTGEEALDGVRHLLGAAVIDEQPRLAVHDGVGESGHVGRDHGPTRRHGLQGGPTGFVGTRAQEDEDVEGGEDGGKSSVPIAGEERLPLEAEPAHRPHGPLATA